MRKLIPALSLIISVSALFGCEAGPSPAASTRLADDGQSTAPRTFQQKLDHLDPADQRTFAQRYLVDSTYADSDSSPVVFFIGGEGSLFEDPAAPMFLNGMRAKAQRYHAHLVALEHRYYGGSMPMADQTAASMQYLSVAQALADIETFVRAMQANGLNGRWIAVSGSYPGSLAAYFRALHPDLVVGALASSAPVRAQVDFPEYEEHAARAFGPECAGNLRRLVRAFDDAVETDRAALADMKVALGLDASAPDVDMAVGLMRAGMKAQNGHFAGLCEALKPADTLAALRSLKAYFTTSAQAAAQQFPGVNPFEEADGLSWWWQQCTEFGFLARASDDRELSITSRLITKDFMTDVFCRTPFGIDLTDRTEALNAQYYERLFQPTTTRIIYTNGSNDPWSELSIVADTPEALARDVHSIMIAGTSHTWDLFAPKPDDSQALVDARRQTDDIILRWLAD